MMLRYTIVPSSLGLLLVGATERGICAVSLADDEKSLRRFLAEGFSAAECVRDDRGLAKWSQTIVEHLDGKRHALDLPIDVLATAFQKRVWRQLSKIPYGQTRSYSAIAKALGQPSAARAARACATNPVAIVVPCHRVIHADGSISGYRWGVERKRAMLAREKLQ